MVLEVYMLREGGARPCIALKVRTRGLCWMREGSGSQRRDMKSGVMWSEQQEEVSIKVRGARNESGRPEIRRLHWFSCPLFSF